MTSETNKQHGCDQQHPSHNEWMIDSSDPGTARFLEQQLDYVKLGSLDPDLRKLIVQGDPDCKIGDGTRSAAVFYAACELRRRWRSDGGIIACVTDPTLDIGRHIRDQQQRDHHQQAPRVRRARRKAPLTAYRES